MTKRFALAALLAALLAVSSAAVAQPTTAPALPPPFDTNSSIKFSKLLGWPDGTTPTAPVGFKVTKFAGGLDYPRMPYVLPNGDVLIVEARTQRDVKKESEGEAIDQGMLASGYVGKSANRITLLRDADRDGTPELRETFLEDLNGPFGVCLLGESLFVANTDALLKFSYKSGQTRIDGRGEKLLDLPASGYHGHWTRNVVASPDGKKLYVTVGSASNVGEDGMDKERRRACILEVDPDGKNERVYADGLRNPLGVDFEPRTGQMWAAVNERDHLGDDLVPDYVTSVREGGFYGWPYSYYGQNEDPRRKGERPDLVAKAIVPDVPVGSHVAAIGLAFYDATAFPAAYRNGAFVGLHGSWNRSTLDGYAVIHLPFGDDGKPSGPPAKFLTGFIKDEPRGEVHGRPAGVAVAADGALLVCDDAGNTVWRVAAEPAATTRPTITATTRATP